MSLPRKLSLLDDPLQEYLNEVSFFRGARDFNVYGGNFYNISGDNLGNYLSCLGARHKR